MKNVACETAKNVYGEVTARDGFPTCRKVHALKCIIALKVLLKDRSI